MVDLIFSFVPHPILSPFVSLVGIRVGSRQLGSVRFGLAGVLELVRFVFRLTVVALRSAW